MVGGNLKVTILGAGHFAVLGADVLKKMAARHSKA